VAVHAGWSVIALLLIAAAGCLSCDSERELSGKTPAVEMLPEHPLHTDHSTFFQAPFSDGPAVTRACIECHENVPAEIMATSHWNWQGQKVRISGHEKPVSIGKRNVINNFCIGIQSNWPACTSCHIGYGWEDEHFDFNDPSRIDCLVCHDNSGSYRKKQDGAGQPDESVDLLAAARSVGIPQRNNCGGCHFQGGGGNAVKHGVLDTTLLFPSARIDVHMGREDMLCVDCHRTEKHRIPGRAMAVSVDRENTIECSGCHGGKPHQDVRLNLHTDRVACQTCHIPYMAVDVGTKLAWDWSEAGQDLDITDEHIYMKIKGRFTWAKKVQPEYYWYNGNSSRYLLGDRIDPAKPTRLTAPLGDRADISARIWPFKVHRGKQPYDKLNRYFVVPNLHGEEGFWRTFDWPKALAVGSEVTGLPYSGLFDFAETEMYLPLSHMVNTADQSLQCRDCHGDEGRLDWQSLGYRSDPLGRAVDAHVPIYLFDENGLPVTIGGNPVSVEMSCGICHETGTKAFLDAHSYHNSVRDELLPPERRILMRNGPRIPADDGSHMDCFLCHLSKPNHEARLSALAKGEPEWSVTATLVGSGLVEREADGFHWNGERVGEDGEAKVALGPVTEENCGACHGMVHDGTRPLFVSLGDHRHWTTEKTGQVFSPQRIRLSAMNLEGKDSLDLAWDVHAERLVSCGDCHYSRGRPQRLASADKAAEVQPTTDTRRRCASCHAVAGTHTWLPERDRHFEAVACESCHVPELEMAAQQFVDATVMWPDGSPQVGYRGVVTGDVGNLVNAYIDGYRPLLRVGRSVKGRRQVLPYNLVTHWYWVDGDGKEPISPELVRRAWTDGSTFAADVLVAFDTDRDGRLASSELRLDGDAKVSLIKGRLKALGVKEPTVRGDIRAYHIHHNIRHGDQVNRRCEVCHADKEGGSKGFDLAAYVPAGTRPVLMQKLREIELDGSLDIGVDGVLRLIPTRDVSESYRALSGETE
jgi:octaheme c-type cytochrome (tetrathionate reductase family)